MPMIGLIVLVVFQTIGLGLAVGAALYYHWLGGPITFLVWQVLMPGLRHWLGEPLIEIGPETWSLEEQSWRFTCLAIHNLRVAPRWVEPFIATRTAQQCSVRLRTMAPPNRPEIHTLWDDESLKKDIPPGHIQWVQLGVLLSREGPNAYLGHYNPGATSTRWLARDNVLTVDVIVESGDKVLACRRFEVLLGSSNYVEARPVAACIAIKAR